MSTLVQEALDFDEIVERELREQCTVDQRLGLEADPRRWRIALLQLKKKTEVQFTASSSRVYNARMEYELSQQNPDVTDVYLNQVYLDMMETIKREKEWRHKANFFLSKIEQRLNQLR